MNWDNIFNVLILYTVYYNLSGANIKRKNMTSWKLKDRGQLKKSSSEKS
jgi:hypothetical protein